MKFLKRFGRPVLAALFSMGLCACGSVEYRQDFQSMAAPIEVIDSNYVESPNDTEVVFMEIPWQTYVAAATVA
jgi:hypothetical protein